MLNSLASQSRLRPSTSGRILLAMSRSPPKSPQQKKALSLEKDCRNSFGENDKGSRRIVPLRKAQESRRNRHKNNQAIAVIERLDDGAADLTESSARQDVYRAGGWRKGADVPLGRIVAFKLEESARKSGRK
jgi:hypothetical protein